jgi:hypothetical protein
VLHSIFGNPKITWLPPRQMQALITPPSRQVDILLFIKTSGKLR